GSRPRRRRPRRHRTTGPPGADDAAPGAPVPARSAPFLALLARHAQGGAWECLQARFPDRLAARFTHTKGTVIDPGQRAPAGCQQFARVLGQREFVLPLERLGARVGRVIPGIPHRIAEPFGDRRLCLADVGGEPGDVRLELLAHLLQLRLGPGLFPRAHRNGRAGPHSRAHGLPPSIQLCPPPSIRAASRPTDLKTRRCAGVVSLGGVPEPVRAGAPSTPPRPSLTPPPRTAYLRPHRPALRSSGPATPPKCPGAAHRIS